MKTKTSELLNKAAYLVLVQAAPPLVAVQQALLPPKGLQVAGRRLRQPPLSLEGLRLDAKPAGNHKRTHVQP
jgi:hypothetical protein